MAAQTLGSILKECGMTAQVIIPPGIMGILDSLFVQAPMLLPSLPIVGLAGKVQGGADQSLLGFASLNFDPLGPAADFVLTANLDLSFRIDLTYQDALKLPSAIHGARIVADPQRTRIERLSPDTQVLLKNALLVRIAGDVNAPATLRLLFPGAENALIPLQCQPDAWVWGDSGFGLHLPNGIVVDDSATEAPPAPQDPGIPFASQNPAWRGLSIRAAELFLPETTPLIGGTPLKVDLEVTSPAGMDARTQVTVPAAGSRPEILATIEWHDPVGTSLAIPPTSVELVAKWQIDGSTTSFNDAPVRLAGGKPLIVRGRYARDPRDGRMVFNLAVEGAGEDGLISVTAAAGDEVPKIFVTATALATAIVADAQANPDPDRDASGTTLHLLLVAATGLSSFFTEKGKVVLHAVEVDGSVAITDQPLHLRLDYSVDVVVKKIKLGALAISMNENVPMRVRYRNVRLEVDFQKQGLDRFHLSFAGSSVLVEDPGGWLVDSPGSLLDIIGTRSGHGSTWFEVDLRFALDLGPVKVSGATIRANYENALVPDLELRGLDARLDIPGLVSGRGFGQISQSGFEAGMAAEIVPLGISTTAYLKVNTPEVLIQLALDLPGPIPLANSGLGLFGMGGLVGINSRPLLPSPQDHPDPVDRQLRWKYAPPETLPDPGGSLLLGLGAVIGTVPDFGFAFSSKAMIIIVTPNLAVRASLDSNVMASRAKMSDLGKVTPPDGLQILGLLVVDQEAVALSLRGRFLIDKLLDVIIPISAYYPYGKSNWFLRIGSDGVDGRGPGPVQATLLPKFLDIKGYAYLMLHGDGITNLGNTGFNLGGFAVGMGFGFDMLIPMGVIFLEMSARAVVGIATQPFMFIGLGSLEGTLHLGPFSLGVSADVKLQVGPGDLKVFYLKVCGEVDLWLTTLRGCVEVGSSTIRDGVPDPGDIVLSSASLMDWQGGQVAVPVLSSEHPGDPPADLPVVWPDALPVLAFAVGPSHADVTGLSARINKAFAGDGMAGSDELRYMYSLSHLALDEFDPASGIWSSALLKDVPSWGAWQVPKHGSGNLPGARELVLLSGELHHWTRKLVNGGTGLPSDPTQAVGDLCGTDFQPVRGWVLGSQAQAGAPPAKWHLPSEASWLQRFHSVFEADLSTVYRELDLDAYTFHPDLATSPLHPGGPSVFSEPVDTGERSFSGGLWLPHLIPDPDARISEELFPGSTLTFSDPLSRAEVYLLVFDAEPQNHVLEAFGIDVNGMGVRLEKRIEPAAIPGATLVSFFETSGKELARVQIDYALSLPVQLLGVSGFTRLAQQAARDATNAARQGAALLTQLHHLKPAARRPLLKADKIYRVTVEIARQGQRKNQPVVNLPAQRTVFYFRTAPAEPPTIHLNLPIWLNIYKKNDAFDPSYLQRYIAGWTPGDHTQYWFRKDPVEIHFSVDHVAGMLEMYNHGLKVEVRRTDSAPGHPDAGSAFGVDSIHGLQLISLMSAADGALATIGQTMIASGMACRIPTPGASQGGSLFLEPNAHYDAVLSFPRLDGGVIPRLIPGIHFSTSRYLDVPDLLHALGFESGAVPGKVSGDLSINSLPGIPGAVGDRALELAMDRLGLQAWPMTEAARTSALWLNVEEKWLLVGVLLEAPEPIERFDETAQRWRLRIDHLRCGSRSFDVVIRNASGSTLLFLTNTPFAPAAPLELQLLEISPASPAGAAGSTILALSSVLSVPSFVEFMA
jgi:hypothetical protein